MVKKVDDINLNHTLTAIKAGDTNAFREIYRLYRKKVYNFAYRFVRCPEEAAELTQDVFVRLWENRTKISPEKNFDAYLYSMIRSQFLNALKKKGRMSLYLKEMPDEPTANSTDTYMEFKECRQVVVQAVNSLSPQAKTAYVLSRDSGCSHEEISVQMGISKNTVSNHIKKSLGHIRNHFRISSPDTVISFLLFLLASV